MVRPVPAPCCLITRSSEAWGSKPYPFKFTFVPVRTIPGFISRIGPGTPMTVLPWILVICGVAVGRSGGALGAVVGAVDVVGCGPPMPCDCRIDLASTTSTTMIAVHHSSLRTFTRRLLGLSASLGGTMVSPSIIPTSFLPRSSAAFASVGLARSRAQYRRVGPSKSAEHGCRADRRSSCTAPWYCPVAWSDASCWTSRHSRHC